MIQLETLFIYPNFLQEHHILHYDPYRILLWLHLRMSIAQFCNLALCIELQVIIVSYSDLIVSYDDLLILHSETLLLAGSIEILTVYYDECSISYSDLLLFCPELKFVALLSA